MSNLSSSVTEGEIRELFEEFGQVLSVEIGSKPFTRSKHAWLKMAPHDARLVVSSLNSDYVKGRMMTLPLLQKMTSYQ